MAARRPSMAPADPFDMIRQPSHPMTGANVRQASHPMARRPSLPFSSAPMMEGYLPNVSSASSLPYAQTRMQLTSLFKKSSSEPLMAHQAVLPMRLTPHPNKVVQTRWPAVGWQQGRGAIDPEDGRRHEWDMGYRKLRFKPLDKTPQDVPEMNLDELRNYLTNQFGSLKRAFDAMDFFQDGKLSAIEWQEGIYNIVAGSFGQESHKFRMPIVPRKQMNERLGNMFALMDEDCDGLINCNELHRPYLEPEESGPSFTRRRKLEKAMHTEEKKVALSRTMLTGSVASRSVGPPAHHEEKKEGRDPTPLRDFAVYMMKSFKDISAAFNEFDVMAHGQLNLSEFVEGARRIEYKGDAAEIFRLLDTSETGIVSKEDLRALRQSSNLGAQGARGAFSQSNFEKGNALAMSMLGTSRKDATIHRKLRQNLKDPSPHECGLTLDSSDIQRPLGQNMRSATGYYTFPRSTTNRLDEMLHPNELAAYDAEQFSPEHGPGYLEQGQEHNPYIGKTDHPRRGDKWKMGATMNRVSRFGPMVPSTQGQADRDLAGWRNSLSHEGRIPSDSAHFKVSNTGGISWGKSPVRPGITNR